MGKTPLDDSEEHYIQVNCYFNKTGIQNSYAYWHKPSQIGLEFIGLLQHHCIINMYWRALYLVFHAARSSFSYQSYSWLCKFQQCRLSLSHWRHKLCNRLSSRMGLLPSPYQPSSFQTFLPDSNREPWEVLSSTWMILLSNKQLPPISTSL